MPVYEQTYRTYEGEVVRSFRWMAIVHQELRVLFSRRMFIFLVLLGNFHFALRILQIYVLDVASKQPFGLFGDVFADFEFMDTGAWIYFDFLRVQSPLLFITLIYAGSGLICNDFRNNLMEVYFSKPLDWRDYVTGKIATLVLIGMGLSALPALFMGLVHVVFAPTAAALRETAVLAVPTILFSLVLVLSMSLTILASSSLVNSSRVAGIGVFMLAMISASFGILLAILTRDPNFAAVAFPASLNYVGELLFKEQRYPIPIDLPVVWPVLFIVVVCAASFLIVCRKVRWAELGR